MGQATDRPTQPINQVTARRAGTAAAGQAGSRPTAPTTDQPTFAMPTQRGAQQDTGTWEERPQAEATHDPHEVTIQIDAVGRQLGDLMAKNSQEEPDGPVFVDESGRRSRLYRRIGILVGMACAVYAVVIVATLLSGNSSAPWLPIQGQENEKPAGKVDTPPLTAESADPTTSQTPGSGATPSGTTEVTPSAGNSKAPKPSVSTSADKPGVSADPKPSQTTKKPPVNPSTPAEDPTTPAQDPVSPPATDPSTPPSTDPTTDPVGGGTGTVADGPASPSPIAVPSIDSSYPENTL